MLNAPAYYKGLIFQYNVSLKHFHYDLCTRCSIADCPPPYIPSTSPPLPLIKFFCFNIIKGVMNNKWRYFLFQVDHACWISWWLWKLGWAAIRHDPRIHRGKGASCTWRHRQSYPHQCWSGECRWHHCWSWPSSASRCSWLLIIVPSL